MKRRNFLKTSALLGAGMTAGMDIVRGAQASGSDVIKVALVGCGNRGLGAIVQRLDVGDNVKLVALADASPDKAKAAYESMLDIKENRYGDKIDLKKENVFTDLTGYKNAIDCCDQVLLCTPPGFRPLHYKYAIEKGKHAFIEKPLCVDSRGYRSLMESNKLADEKGLVVVAGLQRHYAQRYLEWMEAFNKGLMGDLVYSRVYWNQGDLWERPRFKKDTEMSYQLRNWYHFIWLSGDNICEQHVHNIDIANWVHGKGNPLCHPISAQGVGGRQVRAFPRYRESGHRWDHFMIEFTYADGTKMYSMCRQQPRCWNYVSEEFEGTKGYGVIGQSKDGGWIKERGTNKELWRCSSKRTLPQPYQQEHNEMVRCIREGIKHNDGWHAAVSSMIGVLGRMAAQSGQLLNWDEAVAYGKSEGKPEDYVNLNCKPPVMPDDPDDFIIPEEGELIYENSSPLPGSWNWKEN